MGAQISTNLSSYCSLREQRYLNIKSKADLGRYIKCANKSTLMVINFTTTWSQPCIDAEPPTRKLAEEFPDVKFARVDIDLLQNDHINAPLKAMGGDDSQDVVTEFDLKTMPTFLLCKKVDDGLDKGKEFGGGNGSGNRISSANKVKEGNSVVPSATEGKSADSVKEDNRAPGATGGKSGTGVERTNRAAVSGSKGESTTANAKEGQSIARAPKGENATSTVKEGNSVSTKINSMKNGDGVTGIKEPRPKRRAVNYAGKKVFIDEIDRMEGPLEGHELRRKIEYYKNRPTTASFKSIDEIHSYLKKSKPTQLMVINFTTEWCEPCKKADEPFKKLSEVYKEVKFAKVDVDVDVLMNIAEELKVKMMPTFLLVKVKRLAKEHVEKDGMQRDHKDKKEPPEKEYVKKNGVQGDHEDKKEPPEKEHVKKDGVQGDLKVKKGPLEKEHLEVVELARVVGWNKEKEEKLRKKIEEHRYTTT